MKDPRKEVERVFKAFSDEDIRHLRRKCKVNTFFLGFGVLGYNKFAKLHVDLAKWSRSTQLWQFREILLPRSHYKSTFETITDGIQIVLTDDMEDQPYPRNLGPNCRLLISHETSEAAARFLFSITSHFTKNPLLMGLFPECVPNARIHRINKLELELPRQSIWSEPTIDTVGVAGKSQGRHYDYIKCDDIYGAAARDSKAERESTILWVDNLQSLLIAPGTGKIDFIGTRWAHDDIYAHIHKMYGDRLAKYIRAAEEYDSVQKKKVPIFPEVFSTRDLEILKKNRIVYNAQYANNPYEGGSKFQEDWLRYYNWAGRDKLIIFTSKENSETRSVFKEELDIVIMVDPSMTGNAGFVVTGTDSKMNIYVLDSDKQAWSPPEFVEYLFKAVHRWNPRCVVIEEVLFSGLYQHWLASEMILRNRKFKVEQVKAGKTEKEARVLGLANYFSAGQIYFNAGQEAILEEFREFGATDNYHILDAMAMGLKKDSNGRMIWRASINQRTRDSHREAERKLLEARDMITGYGTY